MTIDRYRDDAGRLWTVVACEHLREPLARESLDEAGFETYWPHYAAVVTRRVGTHDRRLQVLRSLFPAYLFAALDDPGEAGRIERTRGVATVCRDGDRLAFLRPAVLEEWRAKALNAAGLYPAPEWANAHGRAGNAATGVTPGCEVRLTGGHTWSGFLAQVRSVMGSAVALEITDSRWWGRPIRATVDASQIERT